MWESHYNPKTKLCSVFDENGALYTVCTPEEAWCICDRHNNEDTDPCLDWRGYGESEDY